MQQSGQAWSSGLEICSHPGMENTKIQPTSWNMQKTIHISGMDILFGMDINFYTS